MPINGLSINGLTANGLTANELTATMDEKYLDRQQARLQKKIVHLACPPSLYLSQKSSRPTFQEKPAGALIVVQGGLMQCSSPKCHLGSSAQLSHKCALTLLSSHQSFQRQMSRYKYVEIQIQDAGSKIQIEDAGSKIQIHSS